MNLNRNHKIMVGVLLVLLSVIVYFTVRNFNREYFTPRKCSRTALAPSATSVSDTHGHDKLVRKTEVYPILRNMKQSGPEKPDMSKYILKSDVPTCPDMSNYVLKTNLLPDKQCPDCVCPKVNVSAGLCKKCEPCAPCPPPKRCSRLECPDPEPCPDVRCPAPEPCVRKTKPRCPKKDCTGCPKCMPESDGLLNHPRFPGSRGFAVSRANNGVADGEPTLSALNQFKDLF